MSIELRYARFGEYPRIRRFLHQFWEKDHIYVRNSALFDWTFGRSDLWDRQGYSFALMEDKDELVGILGAIPFLFNYLGRSSPAVWFANYMVCPDYRRGPLAMRLLRAFHRPPYHVNIVFGMNPRVVPVYQRMGWKLLPPIPRHFVVLPDAAARATHLIRSAYPDWESRRAGALAAFFRLRDIPAISIPFIRALPPSWEARDWPEIAVKTIGASRDLNYLTWRYLRHPSFEYRVLAVPEGNRTGLAIWRLETICRLSAHGREEIDTIGRLVEFLPASRDNARSLLSVFFNELSESGALGADFYGYNDTHEAWLDEFGFRKVDRHPDGERIPSRFQPLDPRPGTILSAVLFSDDLPVYSTESDCLWYWTKSDADQDRPN